MPRSGAPTATSSTRAELAREWRTTASDAAGAREMLAEGRGPRAARAAAWPRSRGSAELEEEIRLAMVEPDPADDKNVIVEVRGGTGGEEAGPVRGRPLPDAHPLRRAARVHARGDERRRRRLHVRDQGQGRLQRVQARGRHAPRPARARDRVAGPHPHLDGDGRGAARGRGRRRPDRPERPPDRRLPLVRPGRSVGQHDRLGGPDHAQADRPRGLDAGREVAAAEPRQGDARAARAALRARARGAAGGARRRTGARRSAPASAPRRSARTTSRRTGSPTTA